MSVRSSLFFIRATSRSAEGPGAGRTLRGPPGRTAGLLTAAATGGWSWGQGSRQLLEKWGNEFVGARTGNWGQTRSILPFAPLIQHQTENRETSCRTNVLRNPFLKKHTWVWNVSGNPCFPGPLLFQEPHLCNAPLKKMKFGVRDAVRLLAEADHKPSRSLLFFEQRPGDELQQRQQADQAFLPQAQETQRYPRLLTRHAATLQPQGLKRQLPGPGAFPSHPVLSMAPHLHQLLQLLSPLHDPHLSVFFGIFLRLLTLSSPSAVLQELKNHHQ